MEYILAFLIGAAAGAGVVWFILSQNAKAGDKSVSEIANLRAKLDAANQRIADQSAYSSRIEFLKLRLTRVQTLSMMVSESGGTPCGSHI